MSKVVVFRGRLRRVGGLGYVSIYVYVDFGGKELTKYVGKEVEGILVVKDEGSEDPAHKEETQ